MSTKAMVISMWFVLLMGQVTEEISQVDSLIIVDIISVFIVLVLQLSQDSPRTPSSMLWAFLVSRLAKFIPVKRPPGKPTFWGQH